MFFCQVHDAVHFGGHTGEVDNDDGFGIRRQRGFDGFGADVLAVQIHVGEHGVCTCGNDAGSGGKEGARGNDDIVACTDAHCFKRDIECQRAVGKGDGVLRTGEGGEFFFKFAAFGARPIVDFVGQQDFGNGVGFFLGEARPWGEGCVKHWLFLRKGWWSLWGRLLPAVGG